MRFKVSAVLPIPADVYFVERDSSAFRSLVAETCKLESLEMGNSWMEGDTEVYEFVTKPDVFSYCPQHLKKFLPGGDLHYTDVIAYDPKSISKSPYRMHVNSIPPIFSHKAKIESWLTIEEVTAETCRQTLEGNIEFHILGLGHVVEKIVVDNLKSVYKGVPKIVDRWVKFRNEVLKQPNGRDILVNGRPKNQGVDWITEQITALIQAEESASDFSSEPSSSSFVVEDRRLPSAEEMMERCAVSTACSPSSSDPEDEDNDDVPFLDARENPTFMNLRPFLENAAEAQTSLERHIQRDNQDAKQLLSSLNGASRRAKKVKVQASPGSHSAVSHTTPTHSRRPLKVSDAGGSRRLDSQRFGAEYNSELQEWREFWKEQEVPESHHLKHSHLRRRLANVFGIGADAGLFKLRTSKSNNEDAPHNDSTERRKKQHIFRLRRKEKQRDPETGW